MLFHISKLFFGHNNKQSSLGNFKLIKQGNQLLKNISWKEKAQWSINYKRVPQRGVEPPLSCENSVLNAACMPFHHCG